MKGLLTLVSIMIPLVTFSQLSGNLQGEQMPEFKFEKKPGVDVSSTSLAGKNLLIVFFATWCNPCLKEMPELQNKVWDKLQTNDEFELLIFGREHCWNDITKFKEKNGYTMPFYPDPTRDVFSKFADSSIPRSYVVNKSGKIVHSTLGFSEDSFKNMINSLNILLKQ